MTAPIDPADDIWNLLPKLFPQYYPTRQDRDRLVERARANPVSAYQRRVEIWDFFFPPDRESLLAPLQAEKEARLAEHSRLKEELAHEESRIAHEIARLRQLAAHAKSEWERWSAGVRAHLKRAIDKKANLLLGAGIILLIPSGLGFLRIALEAGARDSFWLGCLATFLIPPAVGGAVLVGMAKTTRDSLESKVSDAQAREQVNLSGNLSRLEEEDTKLEAFLKSKRAFVAAKLISLENEIRILDQRIAVRDRQIPQVPSIDTVHGWFNEELDELKAEIDRESGKEGDLVKPASAPDQFRLRGPAEIQNRQQIEQLYLTDPDLNKHLSAKRAGKNSRGEAVDLYGVWVIEFLFLGNHDFTSARVTFDFITKQKVVQYRTHSYNAVAQVESGSHFRKVLILQKGGHREELIDDVPFISFALENGQKIDVSFKYKNYLREAFPGVELTDRYEDWEYAKQAVRILRNKVHEARLQAGSQNEGSPGPLGQNWDDLDSPPPNSQPQ